MKFEYIHTLVQIVIVRIGPGEKYCKTRWNVEDDLNFFFKWKTPLKNLNGRRPQNNLNGRQTQRNLNGSRPQKTLNWRRPQF